MWTSEGKKIDYLHPLPEYPTPQFERDSYISLNGPWWFCVDENPENHSYYPEEIIVPYAIETQLSRVNRKIDKNKILHYRKRFSVPPGFNKGRVLLHFEAVDQICDVYLNGVHIVHHEGGYCPFTVDCLELVKGQNELLVDVTDDTSSPIYPRGKQSDKQGGIWYGASSGIWGSVWLESTPKEVIQSLKITPLFDEKKVSIQAMFEGKMVDSSIEVLFNDEVIKTGKFNERNTCIIDLASRWHEWSPNHPFLYGLKVRVNEDCVKSYFAMRKFGYVEHKGHRVFALNGKPYFLTGLLDQGYWPDGGLTPPSDDAMKNDLIMAKSMGFNCIRKHIKIEPMRWYYHCDKLGLIVMQDFVNGGSAYRQRYIYLAPFITFKVDDVKEVHKTGRSSQEGRKFFEEEMVRVVNRLYNVPSIAIWTLFNEGWGQFDSNRLTEKLRELDPTRLIDSTSGWFDQGGGDFESKHVYFRVVKLPESKDRILSLTEFGGYVQRVEGHSMKSKGIWYANKKDLTAAIKKLYSKQVMPYVSHGLSICIYTQLCDVEQELNGLITYDRKITKVDADAMKTLNDKLVFRGGYGD